MWPWAHVYRIGDGGAHLHVWFFARPAGQAQLYGSWMVVWDDLLPEYPEAVAQADAETVADALTRSYGGPTLRLDARGQRDWRRPRVAEHIFDVQRLKVDLLGPTDRRVRGVRGWGTGSGMTRRELMRRGSMMAAGAVVLPLPQLLASCDVGSGAAPPGFPGRDSDRSPHL